MWLFLFFRLFFSFLCHFTWCCHFHYLCVIVLVMVLYYHIEFKINRILVYQTDWQKIYCCWGHFCTFCFSEDVSWIVEGKNVGGREVIIPLQRHHQFNFTLHSSTSSHPVITIGSLTFDMGKLTEKTILTLKFICTYHISCTVQVSITLFLTLYEPTLP